MATAWIGLCLSALAVIGIPALVLAVRTAVRMAMQERNQVENDKRFERMEVSIQQEAQRNLHQDEKLNKIEQFMERIDERTASIVKWLEHFAPMTPRS